MASQTAPVSSANPQPAARRRLRPEPSPSSDPSPVDGARCPHTRDFDVEFVDFELSDQWNDTGGNWWHGSRAPSFRVHPQEPAAASGRRAPGGASA